MTSITVRHHFSAGHRIPGLPGVGAKCSNLHGHTFGVEIEIEPPPGIFLDFGVVKAAVRGWIDDTLDHGYIVWSRDELLLPFLQANNMKHFVTEGKPTTEAIAELIFWFMFNTFGPGNGTEICHAHIKRVHVTEGPHNAATTYG
jgi:6-pyruvoyltetrahydropterin/6-carboxytetrahydropterin synthase